MCFSFKCGNVATFGENNSKWTMLSISGKGKLCNVAKFEKGEAMGNEKISQIERSYEESGNYEYPTKGGACSAKLVTVIQTVTTIGKGTEDDPCRWLYQYWMPGGILLAEHDGLTGFIGSDAESEFPFRWSPG